jgi:hypothetical protein
MENELLKKAIQLSVRKAQSSQARRNGSSLPKVGEELLEKDARS